MELNWEKYKSLQKSKRSIQNLEETMKKSRSIEQWLNDFSKLDNDSDVGSNVFRKKEDRHSGPVISKRKLVKLVRNLLFEYKLFLNLSKIIKLKY